MAIIEADLQPKTSFERDVADTQAYFDSPRFEGIIRLYTARQVAEQRGTIPSDYPVAREAAAAFYPVGVAEAMMRGMRDTADAESKVYPGP